MGKKVENKKKAAYAKAKGTASATSKATPRPKVASPTTHDPFRLSDFAREMRGVAEVEIKRQNVARALDLKQTPVRWGSLFDGLNAPAHALKAFGVRATQSFGAECARAPRALSLRNTPPEHLYEDARALSRKNPEFFCVRHWKKCECDFVAVEKRPHILIAGFVCKSNSLRLGHV